MKLKLWVLFFLFTFRVCGQTAPPPQSLVPLEKPSPPVSGNTISKNELLIPHKAIKEIQRSQRDYALGNVRASARHLENAVRLYPVYLEARNNLGAQYLELHEYEKAIAELQKAIQLSPSAVQPLNNLSIALLALQRYPDAETTARRALALDPQNLRARYILGCTLATENRSTTEAMEILRSTKSGFPESRLLLAQILLRQGAVKEAQRELQDYLAVPGIENRALVEHWLAEVRQLPVSR